MMVTQLLIFVIQLHSNEVENDMLRKRVNDLVCSFEKIYALLLDHEVNSLVLKHQYGQSFDVLSITIQNVHECLIL